MLNYIHRFNPRTPCGVRLAEEINSNEKYQFQSTHSLRSATGKPRFLLINPSSFNPRTPCGVRLPPQSSFSENAVFQSTHSLRSATFTAFLLAISDEVSIHALLAECDGQPGTTKRNTKSFNPRTPCGVRPSPVPLKISSAGFQSTHSLRSATRSHKWL